MGYFRAKAAQEEVVAGGAVPWSMLRATQFHPLAARLFGAAGRLRVLPTGSVCLQPIDPAIVARRLADAVHSGPGGRLPDAAGPEVRTLGELARVWRDHARGWSVPVRLPLVGEVGRARRGGAGICARGHGTCSNCAYPMGR